MSNEEQWCFTWLADNPAAAIGKERAAFVRASMWPNKSIIRVGFLDGDEAIQARVQQEALNWTRPAGGPANLRFSFVPDALTADIRISFAYRGSWSVLGTTCRTIQPLSSPTMNFGWLTPSTSAADLRRVVLHEFGHALGMVHEHLSPNVSILWNKPAVYESLKGPPNSWDKSTIDRNLFDAFAAKEMNASTFDAASIMLYPIPSTWTTNGFSTSLNTQLSDMDISFVQKQYP
jgi:serralysin